MDVRKMRMETDKRESEKKRVWVCAWVGRVGRVGREGEVDVSVAASSLGRPDLDSRSSTAGRRCPPVPQLDLAQVPRLALEQHVGGERERVELNE